MFITYSSGCSAPYVGTCTWTITDTHSTAGVREHRVVFDREAVFYGAPYGPGVVARVELATFGGAAPAVYRFTYQETTISRAPDHPLTSPVAKGETVPLLSEVELPDGSIWQMTHATGDGGQSWDQVSGHLTGLTLPSRGRLEWDYQIYVFPDQSAGEVPLRAAAGLHHRRLRTAGGSVVGTWTYETELETGGGS